MNGKVSDEERKLLEDAGVLFPAQPMPLTKDEAYAAAEMIDMDLLDYLRRDVDIDSMRWLIGIIHAYEKLRDYSGYQGVTEGQADAY